MSVVNVFDENAAEYDRWYAENDRAYQAELQAIRHFMPASGRSLEIGVGTGRFAAPLGIDAGIDPAENMLKIAERRGIDVRKGAGEALPYKDASFDVVLMATADPFLDDLGAVLREAARVLHDDGRLIVAMIDRASPPAIAGEASRQEDPFFRDASLHSADEMIDALRGAGFGGMQMVQTLLNPDSALIDHEDDYSAFAVLDGYGEGLFIVICAEKNPIIQMG
jgi:ubiquinone/menaquinone biosynthesis C-methylase UbiE